jgi:putative ABC transport system permease protein
MENNVVRLGWDDEAIWSDMRYLAVDYDFLALFDIKMKAGRYFDESTGTDELEAFIINESGRRRLGFESPEAALGEPLKWQNRKGRVIGVINDFHFMSPNKSIEPFIMVMNGERSPGYLSLKISSNDSHNIISEIQSSYQKIIPDGIFEYSFLNEDYNRQLKADERFYSLFSIFSILSILIACLGLYGLSAFTAELRFKEIGIRKVLGANVIKIIILLSKDYSKLVVFAMIPAIPISYFAMSNWLQDFPYKAEINPGLFIFAGLISMVVAMFTTSYHAIRAAIINPVNSIKHE